MVFILSDKENKINGKIIEILNRKILGLPNSTKTLFTVVSVNDAVKIQADKGIAIVTDGIKKFKKQEIPQSFMGICAENNKNALRLFKKNKLSVITCGSGSKNTLSISSITETDILFCLQRNIKDISGNVVEPCEIKVKADEDFDLFSLLSAVAVMLYYGIKPDTAENTVL